jgi:hypothetical protein
MQSGNKIENNNDTTSETKAKKRQIKQMEEGFK